MDKSDAVEIDDEILKELDSVDWHAVSQPDAASFGLSIGFFRDSNEACRLRKTALGTALGGVISTSVLAIVALLLGAGPWFALNLVMVHQVIRAAVLWWRARQTQKEREVIRQQAVDTAKRLVERYPLKDNVAAA